MSLKEWNDAKAALETLIYDYMPEITDLQMDKLVKDILEICHVSKK